MNLIPHCGRTRQARHRVWTTSRMKISPLGTKCEGSPDQLFQQYVEKRRTAARLAHGGSGTNPVERQVRDGGQKLRSDLTQSVISNTMKHMQPGAAEDLDIQIGRESLKQDDFPRYLGVSLDAQLCLRRHIEGGGQHQARKNNNSTEAGGDYLGRHVPVLENDSFKLHPTDA
ncbi:hypothetical protein PoB_001234800 [Plakobranchus ocellatus]|uniref:Uncharacterized protein n=1 Tax=Plakobranchus ocellatus TaxID=259542 RepID=A0AAV3YU03_9GAST|nr:hypothetical protein PoB_001234800 [Plakobranchus ocellatus]